MRWALYGRWLCERCIQAMLPIIGITDAIWWDCERCGVNSPDIRRVESAALVLRSA